MALSTRLLFLPPAAGTGHDECMPTRDGPSKIWEARWGTDTDAPAGALSGNVRYFPLPVYQSWADVVFLHWRIPVAVALPYMPPGVEPDVYAGSTWV
ncbi:DUF2071 domain-containing protein, partial [Bacillus mobilis]|uniref:DUF2071 domain-containing protein n=1 Tax=Bacillus mobilis TaxID=2026190 RepID=UPI0036305B7B